MTGEPDIDVIGSPELMAGNRHNKMGGVDGDYRGHLVLRRHSRNQARPELHMVNSLALVP